MKSKAATKAKPASKTKQKLNSSSGSKTKSTSKAMAASANKKTSSKKNSKSASKGSEKVSGKKVPNDIIQIILQDHKPLKELIETLKDDETEFAEKKPVFEEFAPLLLSHAEPEEQSLYKHMKEEVELRAEGFEGQTEHAIASQLIEDINQTSDEDEWMAKVKVLAEMVGHHIEEEEETMFPDLKKELGSDERIAIGEEYMRLRDDYRMENAITVTSATKTTESRVH